jgi:dTDP-3-amino-3,4,6-trideoxy-alpha-D-glucose transaminase
MIEFLDLKLRNREMQTLFMASCDDVIDSGRYVGGPMVTKFEHAFAKYVGASHMVGVGNGLDAIRLALQALGIGGGDEVLVPGISAIATGLAVQQLGAVPVLVDVDASTGLIDLEAAADAVTPRTRAMVPVHLYGRPVNMDVVLEIAERHDLMVVEDCAQAHGATWMGRTVGTIGHAGAFSFYPTKNLGALGDAGGVVTHDKRVADRVRSLANYGAVKDRYDHQLPGWNSRLDPMQANALRVQLPYLNEWNARRQQIAQRYHLALAGSTVATPLTWPDAGHVWHLYVVKAKNRPRFRQQLESAGIGTEVHYPTALMDAPALHSAIGNTPKARHLADCVVSLPCHPWLADSDVDHIVETLRTLGDIPWQ